MRTSILLTVMATLAWLLLPVATGEDDTLDFLLTKATTAPTTQAVQPETRPAAPFGDRANPELRRGVITLSNGERIPGNLATTREKPIRVWVESEKEYRDVPWSLIKSFEAKILWEREQPEWHFKESGSDIKEFTGKTYPARELEYIVTLVNGQKITGGIVAPVYLAAGERTALFVLNKRHKGEVGQTLKDLPYIKKLDLD